MEYKEKVRIAEDLIGKIENGERLEDLKQKLVDQGYSSSDVFAISASVRKGVSRKYKEEISSLVEAGRGAEVKAKFSHIDAGQLDEIQQEVTKGLHRNLRLKAGKLLSDGKSDAEILTALETTYTTQEEAHSILALVKAKKEEIKGNNTRMIGGIALGLVLILVGIVLTMTTERIWYGLIVGGVVVIGGGAMGK